ncbi:glutaminyl-peptide cyclotransferase [Sphingomonas sp. Y38-1Y]|uniref:glutaminyl-peptide cyclotransferase n=1 Tax=Sphingomonas sp. Y38-1Y TaxID=3078265 RepID=UPI0028EDA929|nr:glutaminyl-peptide cyclotransferase [Sphingomonas sp. Y38-1Y]
MRAATILRIAASVLAGAAFSCPALAQDAVPAATCPAPALEGVRVVRRMAHDPMAFTQGLIWHRGALIESTGQYGESQVRRVDAATGRVLMRRAIPANQFGEGLGRIGNELVALTWTNGVAHRFAADTLRPLGTFRYEGEGWGLTSDGKRWIRSDGSDSLIFHDPATFAETGRVRVTLAGTPLPQLNELEWIDGLVFANVWHSDVIVAIDPKTGCVARRFDLSPLVREVAARDPEAVLNGIAWDEAGKRLYVTGKDWPRLFEIALPERK